PAILGGETTALWPWLALAALLLFVASAVLRLLGRGGGAGGSGGAGGAGPQAGGASGAGPHAGGASGAGPQAPTTPASRARSKTMSSAGTSVGAPT
ncbi:MAG TPA: hypothetical protein VGM91_19015, partial [Conexibacter sp.]